MSDDIKIITDRLLKKIEESRDCLEHDVKELETLEKHLISLLPKEVNYRSKWSLEEKIKTVTEFSNSKLRLRQEINKTLKDEITLRKQILDRKEGELTADDIRKLAEEISEINKEDKESGETEQNLKVIK